MNFNRIVQISKGVSLISLETQPCICINQILVQTKRTRPPFCIFSELEKTEITLLHNAILKTTGQIKA